MRVVGKIELNVSGEDNDVDVCLSLRQAKISAESWAPLNVGQLSMTHMRSTDRLK